MASASTLSAAAVALLAAVSVASASDPLEQSRTLRADPCVRLLNNTASIGCATGRRGAVAPLYLARNSSELAAFRARAGPRSVALAPLLFDLPTLTNLHDALGDALAGVLVLDGPRVRDAPSPEPPSAWVPGGSGLARARWPFGMALLDAAESAAVVAAVDGARRGPPLLELRYPMFARESAPACLAADDCLPLGGYSVWGAVEPRTPTAPHTL